MTFYLTGRSAEAGERNEKWKAVGTCPMCGATVRTSAGASLPVRQDEVLFGLCDNGHESMAHGPTAHDDVR